MKKLIDKIKQNYMIILSVFVVAFLLIACISSFINDRRKVTKDVGRVVSLNALYEEAPMACVYARTPYESLSLTQTAVNNSGFVNDNVGAYSDGKQLSEQDQKDKAALQALLATAIGDETASIGDLAKKRKEQYKLNQLTTINRDTSISITPGATTSTAGAVYANNSDGTYLGKFVLTGYCPCVICCGKTNGITASGRKAVANHTIAADKRFAFGTQMIINGQVYTVDDRGGAIVGNHIDIYFNTHAEALQFGRQQGDVYLYTGKSTNVAANTNTGNKGSITLIGDSLTVGATSAFQALAPKANIDGKVGRQQSAAYDIVSSMKTAGTLGDNVIIELGTNGVFTEAAGQKLINNIGKDKNIYWVNTYGPKLSWYSEVNAVIAKLATSNSNVTLVDWCSIGSAHPEYYGGDGIHMSSAGYQAFAQTMFNAVK